MPARDTPTVLVGAETCHVSETARAQLAAAATLPGCVRAAGMPDLHPGPGIPVGAAFATEGWVHPHLVGGDAGCGAWFVATSVRHLARDRVERRLRAAFASPGPLPSPLDDVARDVLFEAIWTRGPRGLLAFGPLPPVLEALCLAIPEDDGMVASAGLGVVAPDDASSEMRDDADACEVLGTIGGGNHFAEFGEVGVVSDPRWAEPLGLQRGALTVMAHSGSRGLGQRLAARWSGGPVRGEQRTRYLGELAGACRFARVNRLLLIFKLLRALGVNRPSELRGQVDIVHNDVRAETLDGCSVWTHRKGAAPARADEPTLVLGSRGAPSWILAGLGAESSLRSVAHGAGRRMSRSEARGRFKEGSRRTGLTRTALGGRVLCDDTALLREEHPDAYKPIEPIVAALEAAGAATRVASVTPLMTVKL